MIKVKSKPKENANTVRKKNRWKDFRDNAEQHFRQRQQFEIYGKIRPTK